MKKKKILVYSLLAVLLAAAGLILFLTEISALKDKEHAQCQMKLDTACEVLESVQAMRTSSRARFEEQIQENLRFMTTTLAADVTKEGYTGPRLYEDGAVVEVRDGKVSWPEGYPEEYAVLGAEEILASSRVEKAVSSPGAEDPEAKQRMVFVSGRIAGSYYYVDRTDMAEILYDQYAFLEDERVQGITEGTFGGSVIMVAEKEDSLPLLNRFSGNPGATDATELGFTKENLQERRRTLQVNGEHCLCAYAAVNDGAEMMIYIEPTRHLYARALTHTGVALASILIILVTITAYIFSVREYVKNNRLSPRLENRYKPGNFRRMLVMAGITGAIIIFVSTAVYQSMDTLHEESIVSAGSLSRLYEYLQESLAERAAYEKKDDENWRVYQGKRIADLIARHPEAASREKLQEYCDLYGIDYLMLFDPDGKEIATNSGFTGLTMNTALGEKAEDFKRLLHGVESIVHEPYENQMTGQKKQIVVITHFNHSNEITPESTRAVKELMKRGVVVRNQTVFLRGVNDNAEALGNLLNDLTGIGIMPYYVFQCRPVTGVKAQFQVPFMRGIPIIDEAKSMMSGPAKGFRYAMSHPRGKIEILGKVSEDEVLFKFHQNKYPEDSARIFTVKMGENDAWLSDDLTHGEE